MSGIVLNPRKSAVNISDNVVVFIELIFQWHSLAEQVNKYGKIPEMIGTLENIN